MSGVFKTHAISLQGLDGDVVTVETAVSQQLPGIAIIGLPDTAIAEAKHRVKVAIAQTGLKISDRFITVNLSPADIPKQGTGFDLAIALGILAASEQIPGDSLANRVYIAELGLTGDLRRPSGLLSMVIAAQQAGFKDIVVPSCAAAEASLVPGINVIAADDLSEVVSLLQSTDSLDARYFRVTNRPALEIDAESEPELDMADIQGQEEAVFALTVAAAGGHHLSMLGPPGAGKTMLASRLPTILPELSDEDALKVTSIAAYDAKRTPALHRTPPFSAPHHSASQVAIIGGGQSGKIRLGAVTKAAFGVLFLDEAPEFARATLDALRQPLETGRVEISRAGLQVSLPANFQLILAANPCPCGNAGALETAKECVCSSAVRVRYMQKISGPLKDRIDIRLKLHRIKHIGAETSAESSAQIRQSVICARAKAARRFADYGWSVNARIPGKWLHSKEFGLSDKDTVVLDEALNRGLITLRGYDKILRLAWSIADLQDADKPDRQHVASALELREAESYG